MNVPSENQESEYLANWLNMNKYIFTHIGNESGLPPKVAMLSAIRKKRMGLSPGVPDYMLILKRGSLLFIELKRQRRVLKNGKLGASPSKISEEQKVWVKELDKIDNVGAVICYGGDEAIRIIKKADGV